MNPQKLLIAVVLLAVLGGAVWYTMENPPSDEDTEKQVLSLEEEAIELLEIERPGQQQVRLVRSEEGDWTFPDQNFPADQSAIGLLTTNLTDLNADRLVADDIADWTQYGFDSPALTLRVRADDDGEEREHTLEFGNQAPGGSGRYARLVGDSKLFVVFDYIQSSFEKDVFDLRDKSLVDAESDVISSLRLSVDGDTKAFAKQGDEWAIVEPVEARADAFTVSDLVRSISNAEMVTVIAEDGSEGASDPGTLYATAEIGAGDNITTLEVFKRGEGEYAARSSDHGSALFEVSSTFAEGLDKPLDDFRNRNVYSFGFQDIQSLEVVQGGTVTTVERVEESWRLTSDGDRELAAQNVQAFIDALRGLNAGSFPADDTAAWQRYGLDPAWAKVSIVTEDGSVAETGLFSDWNTSPLYVAREGEPTVYQMEAAAADTLRQSFEKLTDAPAEAETPEDGAAPEPEE